jgi:endonuclease/exonuclease/phosphatase family metal-dependent hydrolase
LHANGDGLFYLVRPAIIFLALVFAFKTTAAETNAVLITTLNCYFFFGGGVATRTFDQPRTPNDYWKKAANLVSLLPTEAPLIIGLQEVGHAREVTNLAMIASARYHCVYEPIFVAGKDTFTEENVAALLRKDGTWGLAAFPARDAGLDNVISKHLVLNLTNSTTSLTLCVVHLRRAVGRNGPEKQVEQDRALLPWTKKSFQQNTNANLIILGDFNETKPPGDASQSLAVLRQSNSHLHDAFEFMKGRVRTPMAMRMIA